MSGKGACNGTHFGVVAHCTQFPLFSRQKDAIKYLLRFEHKQQNKNYIITQRVDLTIYSSYITQGSISKRRTLTQAKRVSPPPRVHSNTNSKTNLSSLNSTCHTTKMGNQSKIP